MELPVANQPPLPEKSATSKRFAFATGDRPLSGYTIKRGVGRGGFGEVYFAVSDGGKEVALKLIRRNLDVELRGVQHCLNLKHPNLVALYDVRRDGEDDDCWIVMEYVAGESLESAIRRQPDGMPPAEALEWLRGIAAGAAYLHSHGIVHRDLKPGNIFRDESVVKLGDYGLSKFISCSRRSGQTESVGTVHYMAPEISHGRYGREIDIYALGVILYEMLTGRVPFDGESVGEVLMKHLTAQPDVSLLPEAFRSVVARALAKDPAVRFSTIEQFMAALPGGAGVAAVSQPQIASRAAEPMARTTVVKPVRPTPVLWALAGAVFCLIVGPAAIHLVARSGQPSSLFLLALPVIGGSVGYFLAKRRGHANENQVASLQNRPASSPSRLPVTRLLSWPIAVVVIAVVGWFAVRLNAREFTAANERGVSVSLLLVAVVGLIAFAFSRRRSAVHRTVDRQTLSPDTPPPLPAYAARARSGAPPRSEFEKAAYELGRAVGFAPERSLPALVVKKPRERWIELFESLEISAGVAVVLAVIAAAWLETDAGLEGGVWFALTSTVGAWSILTLSKMWEGTRGEPILRRFAMTVVGLGVGAASFGFDQLLMVRLPFEQPIRPTAWHVDWSFYDHLNGAPHLEAYLAYFGVLFFLVPWWRQADALRYSRLQIGSLIWTIVVAIVLNVSCPFPQPFGAIVAVMISLAVQLASPPLKATALARSR